MPYDVTTDGRRQLFHLIRSDVLFAILGLGCIIPHKVVYGGYAYTIKLIDEPKFGLAGVCPILASAISLAILSLAARQPRLAWGALVLSAFLQLLAIGGLFAIVDERPSDCYFDRECGRFYFGQWFATKVPLHLILGVIMLAGLLVKLHLLYKTRGEGIPSAAAATAPSAGGRGGQSAPIMTGQGAAGQQQMQQMSSALTPSLTNQVDPPTMPAAQGAFVPSAAPVTVQGSFLPSEGGSSGAVPMGAPVAGSSGVSDLGAQLQQLADMRDKGVLDESEFKVAKQKLLGGGDQGPKV